MKYHEPAITSERIRAHGVTSEEYEHIKKILGREPNFTELGIFSVMWSEHCSYKNSRALLKTFPKDGKAVMVKAGEENAGCVDIGDNLAVVFKMESHNHPSAVEPFQGAATGLGGILRDIFTMGARPIFNLNSLRFGNLDSPQSKHLLKGVVAGVAHYGNCIGVPTVGGEIYFDSSYEGNPLVNVMSVGILKHEELAKGAAKGIGNPVYYVGADTGRDGLGGAAFASRELTEESQEDRPAVQVGDPFKEKLLLEACLEVIKSGAVVGIQDMGAAGLTCSTCETASRAGTGIQIDLDKLPQRETGMIPYEMMLSESQERMLIIAQKGKEKIVEDIFEKWDLHAVKLGEVTEGHLMRVYEGSRLVAEIPAKALADEGPVYIREEREPAHLKETRAFDVNSLPCHSAPASAGPPGRKGANDKLSNDVLLKLLDVPSIASKAWIYEQYDHMVRTDTVYLPGRHDAALVRIKGTRRALAASSDCNGLYCYLDPYEGSKIAVAEAVRNVICTGAEPLGITDCLNFGNPMKPEVYWTFHQAIRGISDACRAFGIPVTGGNVSFYNENPGGAIYPTPTIGVVGVLDDISRAVPMSFQQNQDIIYLVGETFSELGGSQYLLEMHGMRAGIPPRLDLKKEMSLHQAMLKANKEKLMRSVHDLSDGGLAVALAECCMSEPGKNTGAQITSLGKMGEQNVRTDAALFGESQSRAVMSVAPENTAKFEEVLKQFSVPFQKIGVVGGERLKIADFVDLSLEKVEQAYRNAIPKRMA
ncbi:MAG: phosphoribosylformylglycinamidine synthase subunit PurL [Candidatus Omnitrophica bacterium]|nr:phosphoribosylformylglycinamidine synthase subunit PurL [Candidatus Omnitrophota bacterium]